VICGQSNRRCPMPVCGYHEVWVEIDGARAKEYAVEIIDGQSLDWRCEKQVTCWVASELGKVSGYENRNYLYYLYVLNVSSSVHIEVYNQLASEQVYLPYPRRTLRRWQFRRNEMSAWWESGPNTIFSRVCETTKYGVAVCIFFGEADRFAHFSFCFGFDLDFVL
jgi:hypothetical protein